MCLIRFKTRKLSQIFSCLSCALHKGKAFEINKKRSAQRNTPTQKKSDPQMRAAIQISSHSKRIFSAPVVLPIESIARFERTHHLFRTSRAALVSNVRAPLPEPTLRALPYRGHRSDHCDGGASDLRRDSRCGRHAAQLRDRNLYRARDHLRDLCTHDHRNPTNARQRGHHAGDGGDHHANNQCGRHAEQQYVRSSVNACACARRVFYNRSFFSPVKIDSKIGNQNRFRIHRHRYEPRRKCSNAHIYSAQLCDSSITCHHP